jgi:DNA-binding GntR family transcriptional regulator
MAVPNTLRAENPDQAWAIAPVQAKEHQVAGLLGEKIIAGSVVRGQKLKQADIAKMPNVSITPVREALRMLEAQGYVHVSSHKGAVVAPFQIEQFVRVVWAKYPFDLLGSIPGRPPRVLDHHAELITALQEGDPKKAMQSHITSGHRDFKATYV